MMNNLEKQNLIKRENLHPANYMQSILEEAYRLNLLSDAELENIQMQSIQLLANQTERYTFNDSSSVKVETAQSIMQSIFYTVGIYLKSLPDTDLGIQILKEKPLSELFKLGKELVKIQFDEAKKLLKVVQNNNIVTDNHAYNDTIQNGIPLFFSAYDGDFAAHDTPGSIDYPLASDKMTLVGVEYIYNYLQKLFWENHFCQNFTSYDINCLLRGYNEQYQDLLVNIWALVITNLLGSLLANKDSRQLNIDHSDRQYLQQKLADYAKEQLDTIVQDASVQLCKHFNITDSSRQKYIAESVMYLSSRLKSALDNNRLETIFISLKVNQPQTALKFEDSEKMDDELFRSIVDEIRECRYVSDKIAIIKKEIHSFTDLVDILEGYCIFDNEFAQVFQSFGDMELALLAKKLPAKTIDADLHFTENEKEWQNKLKYFLEEIDLNRREKIKILSEKINSTF